MSYESAEWVCVSILVVHYLSWLRFVNTVFIKEVMTMTPRYSMSTSTTKLAGAQQALRWPNVA